MTKGEEKGKGNGRGRGKGAGEGGGGFGDGDGAGRGRGRGKGGGWRIDVAPDVQRRIEDIAAALPEFAHVDARRVVCFRSRGSKARIYARIWGLDRIWQMALGVEAHYAVEVVEAFDRSPPAEQDRTLIHELMHIPKTFSGALVPHACFGHRIDCASVEQLYRRLLAHRAAQSDVRPEWVDPSPERAPEA